MLPRRYYLVRVVALGAILEGVTACSGREVPSAPGAQPVASTTPLLICNADVRGGTLTCSAPAGASTAAGTSEISADLILGGQGISVQLRSSNVSYDAGTQIFQADVTVQNLTALTLGTPDGTTVTGVRVFFYAGPSVVSGSGVVTVANADGVGTFTATSQPYFLYDQLLQTAQVSSAKTWRWAVPSTVGTFTFQVLVDAPVPSVLTYLYYKRGVPAPGLATLTFTGGSGTLDLDGHTITGVYLETSIAGAVCLAGGSGNVLTACGSTVDPPHTMRLCGPDGSGGNPLLYVLFESPDDERVTATATQLLNAVQSATNYEGIGVFSDCSTAFGHAWTRNYPFTNYYYWPDVFTTYSPAYVSGLLNGAVVFSTPTAANNFNQYVALRNSPGVFEVWH